jgi:hypothetical protein
VTTILSIAGVRLDIPFTKEGGPIWFIGYRGEFPPADKFETCFGKPVSMRHTIYAGLEVRALF